jgi:hypothetical protein
MENNMSKKSKRMGKKDKEVLALKPPEIESTPIKFWNKPNNVTDVVVSKTTHPDKQDKENSFMEKLKEIFGVKDSDLALSIFRATTAAIEPSVGAVQSLNIITQTVNDLGPEDAIEARLAAQAAVVFTHGMECLQKAGNAEMLAHKEAYVNLACKLLRLHAESVEAMTRYHRKGEQKIIVSHAVMAEKAIVNNFRGEG